MSMDFSVMFYHPNVCHICRSSGEICTLKTCRQCKMIAYCSISHQKQHWRDHKEFCLAVADITKDDSWKNWSQTLCVKECRLHLQTLLSALLKRAFTLLELRMIFFHKSCAFCYTVSQIEECPKCLSFFVCSKHLDKFNDISHDCEEFSLNLKVSASRCLDSSLLNLRYDPKFIYPDIISFIKNNATKGGELNIETVALFSEHLTRPLTVVYALSTINFCWPKKLEIHVVGANYCEYDTYNFWSVLISLGLVEKMSLVFVGPEIDLFESVDDKIIVKSYAEVYHEFASKRPTPDVICSFNCGFHDETYGRSWGPTLSLLASIARPIIFTSYNLSEAVADAQQLRDKNARLRVHQYRNPFSCTVPLREFDSSGIYYVNSILSVVA